MSFVEPVTDAVRAVRASEPFALLRKALDGVAKLGPLVFVPNTGNWGDSLINNGARDFLDDSGHAYTEATQAEVLCQVRAGEADPATVLLVAGNGAWCKHWHHVPDFLMEVASSYKAVLLLPTTIEGPPNLPDYDLPDNVLVFTRDATLSPANRPGSHFCHDMAFQLKVTRSMREPQRRSLYAFRVDGESANPGIQIPASNLDLSLLGNHLDDPLLFLEILSGFSQVLTDRLHVAIGAAMLGLDVHIWPNDYGKTRAIYDSSLAPYFPNVTFHEWTA